MAGGENEIAWAIWSALATGAGLAGLGLFRSAGKFRQWKQLRARFGNEVVLGDGSLRVGQTATLQLAGTESLSSGALPVTIAEIGNGTLRLRPEMPRETLRWLCRADEALWPEKNAEVQVTVTSEGGLYCFSTRIRNAQALKETSEAPTLTVQRPFWLARIQRRRNVRVALALPAAFEEDTPASASPGLLWQGTVRDLSGGGLRADLGGPMGVKEAEATLESLAPGTVLRARLPLPVLSAPLLCRVQSCERVALRGGLGVRVACAFLPMESWQREILISHVFQAQREQAKMKLRPAS